MNWVKISKNTKASEVPGVGCFVLVGNSLCFAPRVCIQDGKLAPTGCETILSWSAGDTGTLTRVTHPALAALNKFIQQTWKITPTARQLGALRALLVDAH